MKIRHEDLHLKGSIPSMYAFSILIVILITIVSMAGILFSPDAYPAESRGS